MDLLTFWVVATSLLDERFKGQGRIVLSRLQSLEAHPLCRKVPYVEIQGAVRDLLEATMSQVARRPKWKGTWSNGACKSRLPRRHAP